MTNYLYSEEFQDLLKSQKKQDIKLRLAGPSAFTMKFIMGYGAALSVIKTTSIGSTKILLN
jgi:hypothetical protein